MAILKNNGMAIVVGETRTRRLDKYELAYVQDLHRSHRQFIVVSGLHIDHDNNTCEWDYALAYDLTHDDAARMLYNKWHERIKN